METVVADEALPGLTDRIARRSISDSSVIIHNKILHVKSVVIKTLLYREVYLDIKPLAKQAEGWYFFHRQWEGRSCLIALLW